MHRLGRWRARKHARTRFVATLGCECVMQHAWLCACNATDPGAKLTRNKREPAQRRVQPALVFAPQLFRELRCPHARVPARPHTLTRAYRYAHTQTLSLSLPYRFGEEAGGVGDGSGAANLVSFCFARTHGYAIEAHPCSSPVQALLKLIPVQALFKPCSSSVQAHPCSSSVQALFKLCSSSSRVHAASMA